MMCVTAHPDDECFGFGGALALAADRGIETYVLCLTDGQAGTYRGDAKSGAELGEIRKKEFAASCQVLGVTHYELLDYEDGRTEFGEGGPNTHNDHMMASLLTTAAFHWAGREKRYPGLATPFQPRRLYYISTNFFIPGRQAPLPGPWTVKLDIRSVQARKAEAFRQHLSQGPLMEVTRELFETYGGEELYTLVATEGIQAARLTDDLFEGLSG
jgi:LmbE family N-acetylglucosaminyl deacetylase